jgi:hypothetical protein
MCGFFYFFPFLFVLPKISLGQRPPRYLSLPHSWDNRCVLTELLIETEDLITFAFNPPILHVLSSWDYSCEPLSPVSSPSSNAPICTC